MYCRKYKLCHGCNNMLRNSIYSALRQFPLHGYVIFNIRLLLGLSIVTTAVSVTYSVLLQLLVVVDGRSPGGYVRVKSYLMASTSLLSIYVFACLLTSKSARRAVQIGNFGAEGLAVLRLL